MTSTTEPLYVPAVTANDSTLTAALAYAAGGFYVGPARSGTKNPGSVLGPSWPQQSTRDPQVITLMFAGTSHGVFLHTGRSGVIAVDVDDAERLHPAICRAVEEENPPFQSTRPDDPGRGHYLFAVPPDRQFGNSLGALGGGWGDFRGRNGVIVAAPSEHPSGGRYDWLRPGPVPMLPAYLADQLPDALDAAGAATDGQVSVFLAAHQTVVPVDGLPSATSLLDMQVVKLERKFAAGESRHASMCGPLAQSMREAAAGVVDAKEAADTMEALFLAEVAKPPSSARQSAPRTGAIARSEWVGLLSWAVAQAQAADPATTLAELRDRFVLETLVAPADVSAAITAPPPVVASITLGEGEAVFRRWLGEEYDLDAMRVALAAAAVERMNGDPLWVLVVSGSGAAKTVTVTALEGAGALVTSTIQSVGALLSATSRKERSAEATGGLLRKLGDSGLLVLKDVTSLLSASRDTRAEVLAAFREVYDGYWSRNVGTDGGQTLDWHGRIGFVGAVTTAWDRAHDVVAAMGDRFVLIRMDSTIGRQAAGRRAIGNTGQEMQMQAELAEAVAGVLAGMTDTAPTPTEDETELLLKAADLVTRARTAVDRDFRGDVIDAHAPEMPTRFAKQLAQVLRGGIALGMDRSDALQLAVRCARDSMSPIRLAVLEDVANHPGSTASDVRRRIAKPRATVDRELQALHMLELLDVEEEEASFAGKPVTRWCYTIRPDIENEAINLAALPRFRSTPTSTLKEGEGGGGALHAPAAESGTEPQADRAGSDPLHLGHLPGRCPACGYHVNSQGHGSGCPRRSAA